MGKGPFVTISEFAKLIGVSRQRVNYAVNKSKIAHKIVNDVKMVEPKSARKQWAAEHKKGNNKSGKGKDKVVKKIVVREPKVQTFEGLTTADADRRERVYKAKLSELKYLEQAGELVKLDEIKREAFDIARKTRDSIMSLPAKLAHELAGETDPHKVEILLNDKLTKALERIIEDNQK